MAVLVSCSTVPHNHQGYTETINDAWAFVSNFWRAVKLAPKEVARFCDWPVNAIDLQARHRWLFRTVRRPRTGKMTADTELVRAEGCRMVGLGHSLWIGEGWCVPERMKSRGDTTCIAPALRIVVWHDRP